MDYGKAFSYPFQDPEWVKKILIGGLMYLLGFLFIPLFFPMGYMIQTMKNVATGVEPALPQWDDWGGYFVKGLMAWLIPMIIIWVLYIVVVMVVGGGASATGSESVSNAAGSIMGICMCGIYVLQFLYAIVLAVITPAALMKYAVTGEFGAAFRIGELFALIKKNIGAYIVVILLCWVAGLVGELGVIACGIGLLFTMFYAVLVMAHLFGQYYRFVEGGTSTETAA